MLIRIFHKNNCQHYNDGDCRWTGQSRCRGWNPGQTPWICQYKKISLRSSNIYAPRKRYLFPTDHALTGALVQIMDVWHFFLLGETMSISFLRYIYFLRPLNICKRQMIGPRSLFCQIHFRQLLPSMKICSVEYPGPQRGSPGEPPIYVPVLTVRCFQQFQLYIEGSAEQKDLFYWGHADDDTNYDVFSPYSVFSQRQSSYRTISTLSASAINMFWWVLIATEGRISDSLPNEGPADIATRIYIKHQW